ncbi:hypothetical protein TH53_17540 [Pedobacter lusitanus]|uniref:Uncharacterized protein n=1 Tax=Pedobacter lusitanus TaxID=1503925 RepID=A0A0D0F331_9SPHI|nr:hypothetical protein TH53_17540 [Pedobacter lusitanus]
MVRLSNHFLEDLEKLANVYKNSDFFQLLEDQYKLEDFKNKQKNKSEVTTKKKERTSDLKFALRTLIAKQSC